TRPLCPRPPPLAQGKPRAAAAVSLVAQARLAMRQLLAGRHALTDVLHAGRVPHRGNGMRLRIETAARFVKEMVVRLTAQGYRAVRIQVHVNPGQDAKRGAAIVHRASRPLKTMKSAEPKPTIKQRAAT